jgi:hypothetical protein
MQTAATCTLPEAGSQLEIENRRHWMTVLIAWGSLSIGIVIGAMWRSLCEKQSRRNTNIYDGSANWQRLDLRPEEWQAQHYPAAETKKRTA